jgi:hypothetical protein
MKKTLVSLALLAALVALGCGGGQRRGSMKDRLLDDVDDNVDPVVALTGIDEGSAVAVEEDDPGAASAKGDGEPTDVAADGEAIGGSQGAFVGTIMVKGKAVSGSFEVRRAESDGAVVKSDLRAGSEVMLEPGTYDFVFKTDTIAGSPEVTLRDVVIPKGRRIKREVKFPVGEITLVTGARCVSKALRIKPKGSTDWYDGKYTTCKAIILLAGEYEAEIPGSRKEGATPISGIQVYDGGVRDILIRKQ